MLEVTVNDSQEAVVGDVALEVLTLDHFTTLVRTWQRIVATHRPVVGGDIFVAGIIILTVLTLKSNLFFCHCSNVLLQLLGVDLDL